MVEHFLGREPRPGYAVFRARLGLTAAALASSADPIAADRVFTQVADETITSTDGYAARDVLRHPGSLTATTSAQRDALGALVTSSGLGGAGNLHAPIAQRSSQTRRSGTG